MRKMDKPIVLYRIIVDDGFDSIYDITTHDFERIEYHENKPQPRVFTCQSLLNRLNDIFETQIYNSIVVQHQVWRIKNTILLYRLFLLQCVVIDDIAKCISLVGYQLMI